ncbi:MAG: DNA polymerase III subunit gamma/tau [Rickettsiales bacterium]
MSSASPSYVVLATKYRPGRFEDLRGQDVLVRTLQNAIRLDRIANAFIMTGIRGVGKTTTARIIAKSLNCVGGEHSDKPAVSPCGACEQCVAVRDGRHPDVLEMDAASHTGVDDVREIIDMARYAPSMGRYKIFIVDEVHMLSRSAFNALLKTLEEPPARVKFIFATTEIRKVPATILSRCQRFDLKRVETESLARHLAAVCETEERRIEPSALALIARAAEGSVRDSLSLLDQILAMQEGVPTAEDVRRMLGMAESGRVVALFSALCEGDVRTTLALVRRAVSDGQDPMQIVKEAQQACHHAGLFTVAGKDAETDTFYDEVSRGALEEASKKCGAAFLMRMWSLLIKCAEEFSYSYNAQATLEMGMVRLCYASSLPTPEAALRALAKHERALPPAAPDKKKT